MAFDDIRAWEATPDEGWKRRRGELEKALIKEPLGAEENFTSDLTRFLTGGKISLPTRDQMAITLDEVDSTLRQILRRFCDSNFSDDDNLIRNLGLVSADGIDLTLELEDELGIEIDRRENPVVDDERRRGRTVRELAEWVKAKVQAQRRKS